MLASEIQSRRNKRRLIFFIALIGVTILTAFLLDKSDRAAVDKNVFRKVDLEAVDRIVIQNPSDTVDLQFQNSRWRVNNKFPADRNMVTLLFATLKQVEPKREVTSGDSLSAMFEKGHRVTLFSGGNAVQSLHAVGNSAKTQSLFKDPTTGKIYLVTIPGYRVYVSGIFELDAGGWRDKMIYGSFNWRNFQGLEVEFTEKPAENFRVQAEGTGLFGITGVKTDTAKLNTFLDEVSLLTVNEYPQSVSLRDSLTQVKPFMNIIITDITGKQHTLRIFRENQDGILGLFMENEPVLFSPERIRNIIRPKSYFIQK
jgi:hypothetical protein